MRLFIKEQSTGQRVTSVEFANSYILNKKLAILSVNLSQFWVLTTIGAEVVKIVYM